MGLKPGDRNEGRSSPDAFEDPGAEETPTLPSVWKSWRRAAHKVIPKNCKDGAHVRLFAAAAAKSLQSCPTLYDPMDCSPPGSSVCGIFQARVLEWVATAFSESFLGCKQITFSH